MLARIVERLQTDDEFLSLLIQTCYISFTKKYLLAIVDLTGSSIRDLILLFGNEIPKLHRVAALMRYADSAGPNKFILNEAELARLSMILFTPDGDFIRDIQQEINLLPMAIRGTTSANFQNFINFIEPNNISKQIVCAPPNRSLVPTPNRSSSLVPTPNRSLSSFNGLIPPGPVPDMIEMHFAIETEPLLNMFQTVTNFMTNNVHMATSFNYIKQPSRQTALPGRRQVLIEDVSE